MPTPTPKHPRRRAFIVAALGILGTVAVTVFGVPAPIAQAVQSALVLLVSPAAPDDAPPAPVE